MTRLSRRRLLRTVLVLSLINITEPTRRVLNAYAVFFLK
jgi:hypothetical protein